MSQAAFHSFETAHGFVSLAWRDGAVVALRLPDASAELSANAIRRRAPGAVAAEPAGAIAELVAAIRRYFEGAAEDFRATPVDLGRQEPFFARVYEHIRALGWGETTSYGAIAQALKANPAAARTVGQAMAANPIPLIVPCHRVLAAHGALGGFSAPGGSIAKGRMLELEGALPKPAQAAFVF